VLKVFNGLLGVCSDADTEITLEFYEKPSKRAYPDYYRQISHPTALKDIQKAVSNNKFPSWEDFITEVEYLWENATTYNEEGSFIHENANKLRVCPAFPSLLRVSR
jgi:Bromodomain